MESISPWQQKNRWLRRVKSLAVSDAYRGLPSASGVTLVDALVLGSTIRRLLRVQNVDAPNMPMAG